MGEGCLITDMLFATKTHGTLSSGIKTTAGQNWDQVVDEVRT